MTQKRITDDLHALMAVLPPRIVEAVKKANNSENLLEIILDLGRAPMARFVDHELELSKDEVTRVDIDHVVSRIGEFDAALFTSGHRMATHERPAARQFAGQRGTDRRLTASRVGD